MEIDSAIRNADNKIIAGLAVAFLGLVFLIGIAENDVPDEVAVTEATFDVAPPIAVLPPPADGGAADAQATLQLAHLTAARKKDDTWSADETAGGTRPDSLH